MPVDAGAHQAGDPQQDDESAALPNPGLRRQPREPGAKGVGVFRGQDGGRDWDTQPRACFRRGSVAWGPDPDPAGVSGGFWPWGSGPCFVADTTNRQYNFRSFRITFNFGPQSLDMDIDQPGVSRVPVAPDLLEKQFRVDTCQGLRARATRRSNSSGVSEIRSSPRLTRWPATSIVMSAMPASRAPSGRRGAGAPARGQRAPRV